MYKQHSLAPVVPSGKSVRGHSTLVGKDDETVERSHLHRKILIVEKNEFHKATMVQKPTVLVRSVKLIKQFLQAS